jgi:hypothetical protein
MTTMSLDRSAATSGLASAPPAWRTVSETVHADLGSMRRALACAPCWFVAGDVAGLANARGHDLHRFGDIAASVPRALHPADLEVLARAGSFGYVNDAGLDGDLWDGASLGEVLTRAAVPFAVPPAHEGLVQTMRNAACALLTDLEVVLGSPGRSAGAWRVGVIRPSAARSRRRAVVLVDLVQDIEILRPLLLRAASPASPFDTVVAITERASKSPNGPAFEQWLDALALSRFAVSSPLDVSVALGNSRSLLLTASESTAAAHAFAHQCCRVAPLRALRVTIQHGFECIGLRHHRAHDLDFPSGVRFGSDVILAWDDPSALPDLHPSDAGKCIAVGVVKASAERCALGEGTLASIRAEARAAATTPRVLVAENLHSVRLRAPARHRRFLAFLEALRDHTAVDLTVRSHPAGRTLERRGDGAGFRFLEGALRADDLVAFERFVSPPSTVLLDAVCAGVPTAVWSDGPDSGDVANYRGLAVVQEAAELIELVAARDTTPDLASLRWAVDNTAALNGVPAAWNALVHLVG